MKAELIQSEPSCCSEHREHERPVSVAAAFLHGNRRILSVTVGDNTERLLSCIAQALGRSDIVLLTEGLARRRTI
jgi:hypothetical protein